MTCTNNPASVGPAVGSGTVTPTVTGGSANFTITTVNGSWSITQATPTLTLTCTAVTFNGAAHSCTGTATGAGGATVVGTWVYSPASETNVGSYPVTGTFTSTNSNYASGGTATGTLTISPAAVTATAGSLTGVYNGSAQTPSACALTGTFTSGLTCSDNPASVGPAVGSGTVTPVVGGGTSNFAITLVNGAWSIAQATSTVTVTCPASVTYNGAAQTPCSATVTGPGLSQSLTVAYTNNTNAGTATASASYVGSTDYAASSNSASFTINAAPVTATAGSLTGTYNGSAQTPSACAITGAFTGGLTCTDNPASVGPAVGTGTVTPTVSGGTTNFAITLVNGAWSIAKATSSVTVTCPGSVIYNGTAQAPCTATVTGPGLSQSLTVAYTNNTNAGTATATATYAGTTNYAAGSNSATFTISPAPVTATAGSYSGAADGSAHAPSACLLTGAYTIGLTCTDSPASVGPAVGSGTVTPVVSGGSANFAITLVNGSWSITQAALTPTTTTVTCPASVTYSGVAQTPCTATVTGAGGLSQTLTVSYTNNTNAGTASASASYAGDATYAPSNGSGSFSINPVAVTATAGSSTGAYNGSAHTPSACALTGAYTVGLTCADNPASVGPAVGSGTVTPVVSGGSANFAITLVNGAWSITQATPTVAVNCPASATYNGAAQTPCTATATGAGGLNQVLTVSYTNNTNAGTATATANYAGSTNYAAGSNSATFTINAAPVTATAGSYSGAVDGSAHAPSACAITGAYTVGLTCTDSPASVGPAVGSGTVTPVVSGGSANFAITMVNGTWSITQAALTPTVTTVNCPPSVTYSGVAQTPCTATVTGAGGLSQTLTVSYTNNTNAGTASASASYAGDTTYAPSNGSGSFSINPVAVTATAGSLTGAYNGSAQAPLACALTGAYTGGLSCTDNPASVGPAVGSGTVTPTVSGGTSNFAITLVNGAWSITQASSTVAVNCPASVLYNGAAQAPCTATVTGAGGLSQVLTVTYTNNTNAGTATASANFTGDANHAASSNSTTFTINAAPVTATAGSYSGAVDGSAHAPSACLLTGAYTVGLTCTDSPASVGPAVGSGTVTPVVSGGSANFAITLVNGTWSITQAALTPTVTTVSCPASVVYNGAADTPCTATVTGAGGLSQTLTVSYTNNTNAGTASASASYAGNTTYAPSNGSGSFSINPVAVTATAGSYNGAVDGSAHAPTACALTGAYTVGLSCTDNPASVGPAVGSGTVTPVVSGGTSNFAITLVNGSWSITQGSLTPTVTAVSCPASVVYNAAAQTPCTAIVTGAGGLSQTLTVNYANNTGAGTATASASYAGNATYAASNNSATFTIAQAVATVTLSNLAQNYTGSPLPATVSTLPTGLNVTVLYSSASYPSSATAPTNPGSYTVTATVVNPNYAGSATGTLVISSATSGLTLQLRTGMPEPSPYGTMVYFDLSLGGAPCPTGTVQFYVDGAASGSSVTLNGSSCSIPVTFQTATLEPGSHSVYAAYSGDGSHAAGNSNTVTHSVAADTTAVALATSATTVNAGQQVTFTATVTPSPVDPSAHGPAGTVEFFDGSTSLGVITLSSSSPYTAVLATSTLGAGPHSISATYTSSDGEFTGSSSAIAVTVTVTTGKVAPTINWANPANIVYGTALGGTQLDATATDPTTKAVVAGTFAYTPAAGTVLPVGTVNLQASFTPSDTTTYSTQTATVTLTVTAATPTLSLTCTEVPYDGNSHACNGAATGIDGVTAVAGNWSYTPASETAAGNYPVTGTFTSTDGNYQGGAATGTLKIDPAVVTATAGSYNGAPDGSAHSPSACSVTGAYTVGLSCTNNPASVGPGVGSGAVTPVVSSGTSNFAITLVNGAWSIAQGSSTVTTVSCPASVVYSGAALAPCTAAVTGTGLNQTLTVTYSNNTNAGTATANASFAGDGTHAASSNSATFTITQANQAITFTQPTSPVTYGVPAITLAATGGGSGVPVVFSIDATSTGSGTISGSTLTVTGVGNLVINANQAGNSNYLAATQVTRTIAVNVATLSVVANNASRVYGTNNPAFTGSVTGAVRGDTYTESYATVATIGSNVGNYPVVPSVTGADLSDYTVTVQNGTLTITQAGTTTSISTSGSTVTPGQSVTLTAQVAPATTGTPTGSVAFYDGTTLLGTAPLTAGSATMSTSSFGAGTSNALQAVYSGDSNFTTSSSSTSTVSVAQLDFSLAVSGPASLTVNSGNIATYHVIVNPLYGTYPGTVTFAANGLPSGASIAFNPSTIAANGGQQTVTLTVQTAAFAKQVPPSIGRRMAPFTSLALLLIPLLGAGRLRRQGRRLSRLACLLLLLVCSLAGVLMTGCGGSAAFKQIEQSYSITVTSTSGNMQHTAPVTLVVE